MTLAHWISYGALAALIPWLALGLFLIRPWEKPMPETLEQDDLDTGLPEDADVPPEGVGRDPDDVFFMRTVRELEGDACRLEGEVTLQAEKLKATKAAWGSAVGKLRRFIREFHTASMGPLFEGAAGTPTADNPAEAWKQVPLRDALQGFPELKLELLEGAGLKSLADFEAFRAKHGEGKWPIRDIGLEWRSKIEEAVLTFVGKWMAKHAPQEAETDA